MNRRTSAWLGIGALLVVAFVGAFLTIGTSHTFSMDEAKIRQKIDAKIADGIHKHGITVTAAEVKLRQTDAEVTFAMNGTKFRQSFELKAGGIGMPRYNDGDFFFVPSKVEVLDFTFKGEAPADRAKRIAKGALLRNSRIGAAIEENADNVEAWVKSKAQDVAMHMLEKTPLYKLKSDFKGIVIRASLEKIWIENGVLYAKVSLWQLTTTLIIWALCMILAVALAFGLMMSPGWGLAAIAVGSLGS